MVSFRRKVLTALIEAGGELTLSQVEALYERRGRKGDGHEIAVLNRFGYTKYTRPDNDPRADAVGLCITDDGRRALAEANKA